MSQVLDEWKLYQVDTDVSEREAPAHECVGHSCNAVFTLRSPDGSARYEQLQQVAKSGLVLAQTKLTQKEVN